MIDRRAAGGGAAQGLVLYGAGSLREAMSRIASAFGEAHGISVTTQFGASGHMRERIESGERVDVFTSAVLLDTPPGMPPPVSGDTDVDAILDGRVAAAIVYCSGRDRYARMLPDARLVAFPTELQVGPEYGLAVMKDAPPEALTLALTILSPIGQAVLAACGFRPVGLPDGTITS